MRKIKPLSEEGWKKVADQVRKVRNENHELIKMVGEHVSVKEVDRLIKIENMIDLARSELENEMFRRGGPKSIDIFYP